MHDKKIAAHAAITEAQKCDIHSLPGKPTLCWKENGHCYTISDMNLNFWALRMVGDPVKYSAQEKPSELNFYDTSICTRQPAQCLMAAGLQPGLPHQFSMPYGFFPPPYAYSAQSTAPAPPPTPAPAPPPIAAAAAANPAIKINYPAIATWFAYCDKHPDRCGENFSTLAEMFDKKGYCHVDQLASDCTSMEKLSDWLGIRKGTADLLIHYADKDVKLLKSRVFTMMLQDAMDTDELEYV
jgi:hypothetical protein